jgi:hypothetical protein
LEAAADAWDVIATETVGFGAVEVATTTEGILAFVFIQFA